MKIFDKYKCRAVVLMPSFEAYNQILTKLEQSANESYLSLVNDMKGILYKYYNKIKKIF